MHYFIGTLFVLDETRPSRGPVQADATGEEVGELLALLGLEPTAGRKTSAAHDEGFL
jgi:hypothetical protein